MTDKHRILERECDEFNKAYSELKEKLHIEDHASLDTPPIPAFLRPDPAVWEPDDSSTDIFHADDGVDSELTRAEIAFASVWWIGLLVALIAAILLASCLQQ